MKKVIAYRALDGELFEDERKCLEHEGQCQFHFQAWITETDAPCCPEDFGFLNLDSANAVSDLEDLMNATVIWVKDSDAIKILENISTEFLGLEVGFNFWDIDGWTTLEELKNRFNACVEKVKYFEHLNF